MEYRDIDTDKKRNSFFSFNYVSFSVTVLESHDRIVIHKFLK